MSKKKKQQDITGTERRARFLEKLLDVLRKSDKDKDQPKEGDRQQDEKK